MVHQEYIVLECLCVAVYVRELRLTEAIHEPHICENILQYNVHAERKGSLRYAKGMSETMQTLHGLVYVYPIFLVCYHRSSDVHKCFARYVTPCLYRQVKIMIIEKFRIVFGYRILELKMWQQLSSISWWSILYHFPSGVITWIWSNHIMDMQPLIKFWIWTQHCLDFWSEWI